MTARLHPPLHDRVHPWYPDTGEYRLDAGLGEDFVHEGREPSIPISEQRARPAARLVQVHDQVLDRLGDPVRGGVRGGAEHADAPGGVLDDGQDVLALPVQGDGFDEITGQQGVGLGAQELGPGGGRSVWCRIKTRLVEDLPYRGRCDLDAERGELSVDPPVAPVGVLSDQAQDEGADGVTVGGRTGRFGRQVRA
ncbi:hypothetical protein AB0392_24380 [Nonomuraea angiospora]|uniref:hypothetical protein n=1 Tax=Nonomuraea angiospora TaxID=46172 RepID=UPI00344FF7D1